MVKQIFNILTCTWGFLVWIMSLLTREVGLYDLHCSQPPEGNMGILNSLLGNFHCVYLYVKSHKCLLVQCKDKKAEIYHIFLLMVRLPGASHVANLKKKKGRNCLLYCNICVLCPPG